MFMKLARSLCELAGKDLMQKKISRLPLAEMMSTEKKGGWGRTVKGAEKAVANLMKHDDHRQHAQKLQKHLDHANMALLLLPKKIVSLSDEKLVAITLAFKTASIAIPASVQVSLVARRCSTLLGSIASLSGAKLQKHIEELLDVVCLHGGTVAAKPFDMQAPCMRDVLPEGRTSASSVFEKAILSRCLVPRISDGEACCSMVCTLLRMLVQHYETVDMLELDAGEAEVLSQIRDIEKTLSGLTGTLSEVVCNKDEIEHLSSLWSGSGDEVWSCAVALAMSQTPYWENKMKSVTKDMKSLEAVQPTLSRLTAAFDGEVLSFGPHLEEASKALTTHRDIVPEEWLAPFRTLVVAKAKAWFDAVSGTTSEQSAFSEPSSMTSASNVVRELSMAFPMDQWSHEMEAQMAQHVRLHTARGVTSKLVASVGSLLDSLEDTTCIEPPAEAIINNLNAVLSECQVGEHLKDKDSQKIINAVLGAFEGIAADACNLQWSSCIDVLGELMRFYYHDDLDEAKGHITLLEGVMACLRAVAKCDGCGESLGANWKVDVADLRRAMSDLDTRAKPLDIDLASSSSAARTRFGIAIFEVKKRAETTFDQTVCKVRAFRATTHDTHLAQLLPSANGDAAGSGHHWLSSKGLDEWCDWDELAAQFKATLGKISPKALKTQIADAELIVKESKEIEQLLGVEFNMEALEQAVVIARISKSVGSVLKTIVNYKKVEDDKSQKDTFRGQVRAELLSFKAAMGEASGSSEYTKAFPKALVSEIADVLSMKRKRA